MERAETLARSCSVVSGFKHLWSIFETQTEIQDLIQECIARPGNTLKVHARLEEMITWDKAYNVAEPGYEAVHDLQVAMCLYVLHKADVPHLMRTACRFLESDTHYFRARQVSRQILETS